MLKAFSLPVVSEVVFLVYIVASHHPSIHHPSIHPDDFSDSVLSSAAGSFGRAVEGIIAEHEAAHHAKVSTGGRGWLGA